MSGWQWFWVLVRYIVFIIVLVFLYFYKPFEDLFNLVAYGLSYSNSMFWAGLIIGIIGFCVYHWRAYRSHIVGEQNVEAMVLSSLKGSTFIAIMLSTAAALQTVQALCAYLLESDYALGAEFGKRLAALVAMIVVTGIFCIIYRLLKALGTARAKPAT